MHNDNENIISQNQGNNDQLKKNLKNKNTSANNIHLGIEFNDNIQSVEDLISFIIDKDYYLS